VPLLTIVPIPYIAIDNVQIDFKANISASSSSVTTTSDSTSTSAGGSAKASLNWGIFSVSADFQANYSSKKDSSASEKSKYSVEYTMDVSVHAGQSDMPAGLAAILNILQGSITDASNSGTFTFTPASPSFDVSAIQSGGTVTVPITVVVKDNNGVLLANQALTVATTGTVPAFLGTPAFTFNNSPVASGNPITTDKNGQATFTLTATASTSNYSSGSTLTLAVSSATSATLTDTVTVTFTGTFKS
jgi:VCBS repeat-containing protein